MLSFVVINYILHSCMLAMWLKTLYRLVSNIISKFILGSEADGKKTKDMNYHQILLCFLFCFIPLNLDWPILLLKINLHYLKNSITWSNLVVKACNIFTFLDIFKQHRLSKTWEKYNITIQKGKAYKAWGGWETIMCKRRGAFPIRHVLPSFLPCACIRSSSSTEG